MTAAFKFYEGDEVKALVTDQDSGIREGQTYRVEFAYDDVPDLDEPLYSLSGPNGSAGQEALESQLVRTRTAAELRARKLPTPRQIVEAVPLGWYTEAFDLNESDIGGESDAIELYGRTAEGLPFGFRMRVEWIRETDE